MNNELAKRISEINDDERHQNDLFRKWLLCESGRTFGKGERERLHNEICDYVAGLNVKISDLREILVRVQLG